MTSQEKPIVISPPGPGQAVRNANVEPPTPIPEEKPQLSNNDMQAYYYMVSNTLKNYIRYKDHKDLFRDTVACDKCYQIHTKADISFKHASKDIILCEGCFEDVQTKDQYTKQDNSVKDSTGLRWE